MSESARILIIDDDEQFGKLTKLTLESRGYVVEHISESAKALAGALEFRPDLILLDMIMPGEDGGDVKAKLQGQAVFANTPIIFITALVSETDVPKGAAVLTGDGLMLPKTVKPDLLIKAIEEELKGDSSSSSEE